MYHAFDIRGVASPSPTLLPLNTFLGCDLYVEVAVQLLLTCPQHARKLWGLEGAWRDNANILAMNIRRCQNRTTHWETAA